MGLASPGPSLAEWNARRYPVGGLTEGFRGWDGITTIVEAIKAAGEAEPRREPPGTRVRSPGLSVGPYAEFSVDEPIANSSMLVLPIVRRPRALQRSATVESETGT